MNEIATVMNEEEFGYFLKSLCMKQTFESWRRYAATDK